MQKVIINPSYGGQNFGSINNSLIEKNFNLEISKKIYEDLLKKGIDVFLVRDNDITLTNQERLNRINSFIQANEKPILLTNELASGNDSGAEIIYALRDTDLLARDISNEIESTGQSVIKYYQLRDPNDTSQDFYEIINIPKNTESIIVKYGYPENSSDNNFLLNNIDKLAQAVSNAIYNYLKKENIYVVKKGDTLFSIAKNLNISVDTIKSLNNLTNNSITIGQELLIPTSDFQEASGEDEEMSMYLNYIVKAKDTLYKIAKDFNTTVDVLKNINNLTTNTLSIGQIIKIPASTTNESIKYNNYTVKSGDNLYKIANNYQTTVEAIKNLNNLTSNLLSIGQVLKIPNSKGLENQEENFITYIVKSGDSLYKIANNYQTTVEAIKNLNNLTSNLLSINQVLKIPKS